MILVVDLCWKNDSLSQFEFVNPIVNICRQHASVIVRHFSELASETIGSADSIVLCGTALKDNSFSDEQYAGKFEWLKDIDKPVLGICAGMQAMAQAFGVSLMPSKEIGMKRLTVFKPNPLFSGHTLDAYCLHSSAVSPAISRDFDVLARSEFCIQAIKHRTKPLYGVLFHPEVRNEDVVRNFLNQIRKN